LEADTNLEASRAPVNELNRTLGFESGHGCVYIFGYNVSAVQKAGCHVFAVARVTLDHLVVWFKAGHGNLLYGVGFVSSLGSGDNWSIGHEWEVDAWIWYQVSLKFVEIDIE
jgi:hypothetical protein